MLHAGPSSEGFVGFKSLIFSAEDVDIGVPCVVICESDVVASAAKAGDW
jgi:hypothetical protein